MAVNQAFFSFLFFSFLHNPRSVMLRDTLCFCIHVQLYIYTKHRTYVYKQIPAICQVLLTAAELAQCYLEGNIYLYVYMYIHTCIPYVCKLTSFVGFSSVVYISRNCNVLHWGMYLHSCACECTNICKYHMYLYINRVFQLSFTVAQLTQCSIEGYVYIYMPIRIGVYIYMYTTYTYLNRVSQYFSCRLL